MDKIRLLLLLLLLSGPVIAGPQAYEKVYSTKEQVLQEHYPSFSHSIDITSLLPTASISYLESELGTSLLNPSLTIEDYYDRDKLLGTVFVIEEMGKHRPMRILIIVSPEKEIVRTDVLVYREKVGSKVRKKRFLKQFIGKTKENELRVDYDIDGLSGATISSWSVTMAVKKALYLSHAIKDVQQNPTESLQNKK